MTNRAPISRRQSASPPIRCRRGTPDRVAGMETTPWAHTWWGFTENVAFITGVAQIKEDLTPLRLARSCTDIVGPDICEQMRNVGTERHPDPNNYPCGRPQVTSEQRPLKVSPAECRSDGRDRRHGHLPLQPDSEAGRAAVRAAPPSHRATRVRSCLNRPLWRTVAPRGEPAISGRAAFDIGGGHAVLPGGPATGDDSGPGRAVLLRPIGGPLRRCNPGQAWAGGGRESCRVTFRGRAMRLTATAPAGDEMVDRL